METKQSALDFSALSELVAQYESGRLGEAELLCRDALERDPDQLEATYILGRIELERSNVNAAIDLLSCALQQAPAWPELHASLGGALFAGSRIEEAAYHLRRAAELDPNDADYQNNLGVVLSVEGRETESRTAFLSALDLRPDYAEAFYNLGKLDAHLGRHADAIERIEQAVAHGMRNTGILCALGEAYLAAGDFDSAEREFLGALELCPESNRARLGVTASRQTRDRGDLVLDCVHEGAELLARGDTLAAETLFRRALAASPDSPDALRGVGLALLASHRPVEARRFLERLTALSDQDAGAIHALGAAALQLGEKREAVARFRAVVAIEPNHRDAVLNLANTLSDLGEIDEAIPAYRRALELFPSYANLHNTLGVLLGERQEYAAAVEFLHAALRLDPGSGPVMTNLAGIYCRQDKEFKAARLLRRALKSDAENAGALNGLGLLYLSRGRREKAEELMRKAIAVSPANADFRLNLAMSLLARGQFDEGWPQYEWRLKTRKFAEPKVGAARWRGESNPHGVLMVYTEQGFGDNIQFSRYLPTIKERWGGRVVYYTCNELWSLFKATSLPVDLIAWPAGSPYPAEGFDAYISLLSVAGLFETTVETIPAGIPYLRPPGDRVAAWRDRFSDVSELKVGLVWAGSRAAHGIGLRSCDISDLAPLAGIQGVRYYSLQFGSEAARLKEAPDGLDMEDITSGLRGFDFCETAAALANLDLLISIDSATAHAAGATGRPAWIVLPFVADWRWMIERDDSPWYPRLRLYRQPRPNAWKPVWSRVADDLRAYVDSCGASVSVAPGLRHV